MLRLFILTRLPRVPDSQLLRLLLGKEDFVGGLFQKTPSAPYQGLVSFVPSPQQADYLILPHDYRSVYKNEDYLNEIRTLTEEYAKKTIVFAYLDKSITIDLPNCVVLRTSQYRSNLQKNEIIVPPFVEDLGVTYGVTHRHKSSIPTIGFTGWVKHQTLFQEFKYRVKLCLSFLKILLRFKPPSSLQGLYYRRKALTAISNNGDIKKLFFIRTSYSASHQTIVGDVEQLRNEFVSSIQNADLALAVRGDGNYSLRFYEILSLGRIPLYIDTDGPLPLEDKIDYDDFIIRINHAHINMLPEILNKWWNGLSEERFMMMQKMAHDVFTTKLRTDVFYRDLFTQQL